MPGEQSFVVDASVVMKWYVPDEENLEEATRILRDFASGKNYLLAPSLVRCEVANAVNVARRRGRLAFWRISFLWVCTLPKTVICSYWRMTFRQSWI